MKTKNTKYKEGEVLYSTTQDKTFLITHVTLSNTHYLLQHEKNFPYAHTPIKTEELDKATNLIKIGEL